MGAACVEKVVPANRIARLQSKNYNNVDIPRHTSYMIELEQTPSSMLLTSEDSGKFWKALSMRGLVGSTMSRSHTLRDKTFARVCKLYKS